MILYKHIVHSSERVFTRWILLFVTLSLLVSKGIDGSVILSDESGDDGNTIDVTKSINIIHNGSDIVRSDDDALRFRPPPPSTEKNGLDSNADDGSTVLPLSSSSDLPTLSLSSGPDCSDPQLNRLECWLWKLQVEIPPQRFKDWITIDISHMVCTNFRMTHIHSNYKPTTDDDDVNDPSPKMQASASDLAATCSGKYHSTGGIGGDVQASVAQTKGQTSSIQVEFQLKNSDSNIQYQNYNRNNNANSSTTTTAIDIPQTFKTTKCETYLEAHGIQFSGSFSAKLIQAFAKTIGHYITQALHENLCPLLNEQLDPLATKYLHQFDHWVQQYLPDGRERADYLNWNDKKNGNNINQERTNQNIVSRTDMARTRSRRQLEFPAESQVVETSHLFDDSNNSNSSIPVNPQDWNMVHWTLQFFNAQLRDHLQRGWFFSDYYYESDNKSNQDALMSLMNCEDEDCKNMFRGISGWLVSILGETIDIILPEYFHNISLPLPLGTSGSIGMERFYVQGLDLLDTFQVLVPVDDNNDGNDDNNPKYIDNDANDGSGLQSKLSTSQGFFIQVPLQIEFQLQHAQHPLIEALNVHINITQVETVLSTLIQVIDWETTTILQVVNAFQDYIDTRDWRHVSCLVRTIDEVQLTDWVTTILLESITFTRPSDNRQRTLEDDIDGVINTALKLATTEYAGMWTELFHGLIQGPARRALQRFVTTWMGDHSSNRPCPVPDDDHTNKPKWMNFTKLDILYRMNAFFNHQHTRKTMNHFLHCVGKLVTAMSKNSTSSIGMSNMETKYWGSLQEFLILEPNEPNVLESRLRWGENKTAQVESSSLPLPEATITMDIPNFNTTLNLTAFASLQAYVGIQLDYNLNILQNLTIAHLLKQGQCAMLPAMGFRLLSKSMLSPTLGVNATANVDGSLVQLSTNDYNISAEALQQVADWSVEWARELVNQLFEQVLVFSPDTCPGVVEAPTIPDDDNNHRKRSGNTKDIPWNRDPIVWLIAAVVCISQYGLVWIAQGLNESPETEEQQDRNLDVDDEEERQVMISESMDEVFMNPLESQNTEGQSMINDMRSMDRSLLGDIREQIDEEHDRFIMEGQHEQPDEEKPKALLVETQLPTLVRFILPAIVVITIILLFSSNVSVGASVDISVQFDEDRRLHLPGLFEFSLGNTVVELFQAGIYPLCFLVVVFSGIWPYAKLALMLYEWIIPYDNLHQREQRLLVLDALSKFSLVDTYVLVVMLVAFRFHLEITGTLGLDVFVTPKYGFYAFLLATSLSLVLGHGMLYFHRRAVTKSLSQPDQDIPEESIYGHGFFLGRNGQKRKLSCFFKLLFVPSALAAIGLLIMGFYLESFSFEVGGLAGMALGERKRSSYSLLSLGYAIRQSVENPGSPATLLLQVAYYFYAVITPLSCLIFLIIMLVMPLSLSKQRRFLVAAEIANAWSAVEVFVISIGAALFQISTFASFIIGDRCDVINVLLRDAMGTDSDVCFTVEATLEKNFYYLLGGAVLNSFVVSFGLRLAHIAIDERLSESGAVVNNTAPAGVSRLTERLYHLPLIGCLIFGNASIAEEPPRQGDGEGEEAVAEGEEEANVPEWRHWF